MSHNDDEPNVAAVILDLSILLGGSLALMFGTAFIEYRYGLTPGPHFWSSITHQSFLEFTWAFAVGAIYVAAIYEYVVKPALKHPNTAALIAVLIILAFMVWSFLRLSP